MSVFERFWPKKKEDMAPKGPDATPPATDVEIESVEGSHDEDWTKRQQRETELAREREQEVKRKMQDRRERKES